MARTAAVVNDIQRVDRAFGQPMVETTQAAPCRGQIAPVVRTFELQPGLMVVVVQLTLGRENLAPEQPGVASVREQPGMRHLW